jgi:hypothetical protein
MTAMRMVQMVPDQVIGVAAVRHGFVAAARTVNVSGIMAAAAVTRGAAVGVLGRYLDRVLVDVTLMRVVQMTLMKVVDMPFAAHRRMTAAGAVLMIMAGVLVG